MDKVAAGWSDGDDFGLNDLLVQNKINPDQEWLTTQQQAMANYIASRKVMNSSQRNDERDLEDRDDIDLSLLDVDWIDNARSVIEEFLQPSREISSCSDNDESSKDKSEAIINPPPPTYCAPLPVPKKASKEPKSPPRPPIQKQFLKPQPRFTTPYPPHLFMYPPYWAYLPFPPFPPFPFPPIPPPNNTLRPHLNDPSCGIKTEKIPTKHSREETIQKVPVKNCSSIGVISDNGAPYPKSVVNETVVYGIKGKTKSASPVIVEKLATPINNTIISSRRDKVTKPLNVTNTIRSLNGATNKSKENTTSVKTIGLETTRVIMQKEPLDFKKAQLNPSVQTGKRIIKDKKSAVKMLQKSCVIKVDSVCKKLEPHLPENLSFEASLNLLKVRSDALISSRKKLDGLQLAEREILEALKLLKSQAKILTASKNRLNAFVKNSRNQDYLVGKNERISDKDDIHSNQPSKSHRNPVLQQNKYTHTHTKQSATYTQLSTDKTLTLLDVPSDWIDNQSKLMTAYIIENPPTPPSPNVPSMFQVMLNVLEWDVDGFTQWCDEQRNTFMIYLAEKCGGTVFNAGIQAHETFEGVCEENEFRGWDTIETFDVLFGEEVDDAFRGWSVWEGSSDLIVQAPEPSEQVGLFRKVEDDARALFDDIFDQFPQLNQDFKLLEDLRL